MNIKMSGCVKCAQCIYAKRDTKASNKKWVAYKCTNVSSEYYGALLNMTADGRKLDEIIWHGCEYGERRAD